MTFILFSLAVSFGFCLGWVFGSAATQNRLFVDGQNTRDALTSQTQRKPRQRLGPLWRLLDGIFGND